MPGLRLRTAEFGMAGDAEVQRDAGMRRGGRRAARAGELTAYDVLTAGGVDEVESTLLRWAREVWEAWPDAERAVVRKLTVELVPERYFRHP